MPENPQPPSEEISAIARRRDLSIALAICLPALLAGFLADSRWWLIYYGNYAAAVGIPLALACRLRTAPYFLSATAVSLNLTVWLFIAVSIPLPPPPSMLMAVPYYGWLYAPWLACWLIAFAMARHWDSRHAIRNSILTTLCLSVPALLVAGYFSIIISLGNALAGQ